MRHQSVILSFGLSLTLIGEAFALPVNDGVITVDDREFYIGTPDREWPANLRDWPFHYSNWLGEFIETDPVLSGYRVFIHHTGVPAIDIVTNRIREGDTNDPVSTDPAFQVPGMRTHIGRQGILVFPEQDTLEYGAWCTGSSEPTLRVCNISVVYPYAENIRLVAKRFFPGTMAEVGPTFDDIAHRMVEVAVCLDVTEREIPVNLDAINQEFPELRGCKIDLLSQDQVDRPNTDAT